MEYSEETARRQKIIGDPELSIFKTYLSDSSLGKDINNTLVGTFKIQPPTGQIYVLDTLDIIMQTSGAINPAGFDSGLVLTNGILLYVKRDTVTLLDYLDGLPIKLNIHLYGLGVTTMNSDVGGSFMLVKIPITSDSSPIRLDGSRNEFFALETQDAARMNAITFLRARAHGRFFYNSLSV